MALTKAKIINLAMDHLAGRHVTGASSDTTEEWRLCNARWDMDLQAVLEGHDWDAATYRSTRLTSTGVTPSFGYDYQYYLPTLPKFLRMREVYPDSDYRLEGGYMLSDQDELYIRYVGLPAETASPHPIYDNVYLANCVAALIAANVAFVITEDKAVRGKMLGYFEGVRIRAMTIDAAAGHEPMPETENSDDPWLSKRTG